MRRSCCSAPLGAELLIHRDLEKADRAARFGFGAEQRGVGIGDQSRRVGAVLRIDGDADRHTDAHLMALDGDIGFKRRGQPLGERFRRLRLLRRRRDDGEFVAAEARDERTLTDLLKPARHFTQQGVTDRMTEHVIDGLESVEIEAEHAEAFVRRGGKTDGGLDAFIERRAIRQIGHRIVMRQMRDALLAALALGDVVNDGDEIFRLAVRILDGQPGRGDDAHTVTRRRDAMFTLVAYLARRDRFLVFRHDRIDDGLRKNIGGVPADYLCAVDAEIILGRAIDQKILQVRSVLDDDRRRHVLDNHVEEAAGTDQFAFGALALGDVLMRSHPAAFAGRLIDHRDDAAIRHFDFKCMDVAMIQRGAQIGLILLWVVRQRPGGVARDQQFADAAAAPDRAAQTVHGLVFAVPDHQPVLTVEHAQALRHIVQRKIAADILFVELADDAQRAPYKARGYAEQRAGGGRRQNRRAAERNLRRGRQSESGRRHAKTGNAGEQKRSPVAKLCQIAERLKHGSLSGCRKGDSHFRPLRAINLGNGPSPRVNIRALQSLIVR